MEAQSSRTARYSSASLASSSRAWTSCALMLAPLGGEGGGALGPAPWCGPVPGPGEPLRRRFRRARGVRLVVGEHDEALPRGVVALGARVVGVAEPVVRGIEEPLDHHWLRHAGEVPLRVPVRSGGWQLAGGAVVRLDGGGEVPSRRDAAAGMALARCHISASRRGVRHRGAAQAEGEPRSRNRTPPRRSGCRLVRDRVARRRARPVVVPSVPVESTNQSTDGVEVLKGSQRPLERAPGRQQRMRRGPVPTQSTAASKACRGW
jgi:hypothetical protein